LNRRREVLLPGQEDDLDTGNLAGLAGVALGRFLRVASFQAEVRLVVPGFRLLVPLPDLGGEGQGVAATAVALVIAFFLPPALASFQQAEAGAEIGPFLLSLPVALGSK